MNRKTTITIELIISISLCIYLSSLDDILVSNFSIIGSSTGNNHLLFLIWGIVTNIYLYTCMHKVLKNNPVLILAFGSTLLLTLLPYLPEFSKLIANLHVLMGFICFMGYTYSMARVLITLKFMNFGYADTLINLFRLILGAMAFMVAYFMLVNSLIELTYFISMDLILYFIYLNYNVKI